MSRFIKAAKIAALSLCWGVVSVGTLGWAFYLSELLGGYFWGTVVSIPILLAAVAVLYPRAFAHDAGIILAKLRKGARSSISPGNKTYALVVLVNSLALGGVFLAEGGVGLAIASLVEFSIIVLLALFGDAVSKAYALGFEFDFVAGFIIRHKERILTLGAAYTVDTAVNWIFNYPITIAVVSIWSSTLTRISILLAIDLLLCLIWLVAYIRIGQDLLGIETAKEAIAEMGSYRGDLIIGRKVTTAIKRGGKISGFIFLSAWRDPFFAVAFARNKERKINFNDLLLLVISALIGITWWTIFMGSVVDAVMS